jgi:pimeloyl-ACP methyl ester carboxylesterase
MFEPTWERLVWAGARSWMGLAPDVWLLSTLSTLSRRPAPQVLADLSRAEREAVRGLFSLMRSGRGFGLDLAAVPDPGRERAVSQPTLVISSPDDAVLPFAHAEHLAHAIPTAELFASPALSHLIWFGSGAPATTERIADFISDHSTRA